MTDDLLREFFRLLQPHSLTLTEQFANLRRTMKDDTPPQLLLEFEMCFYSGVASLLYQMKHEIPLMSEQDGVKILDGWTGELKKWREDRFGPIGARIETKLDHFNKL